MNEEFEIIDGVPVKKENSAINNQGISYLNNGWSYNRSSGIYNKFNNPEINNLSPVQNSTTLSVENVPILTPSNTQINFSDYNNLYGTNLLNNLLNTYNYNTNKSARWNRRLMKQNLMSAGISRSDAKAMATDITGRMIAADNGIGTNADKRWVNNRANLYHDNGKGGIVRNQTNTGNILGSIGMGLIGGPAAAGMYAATRNWNNGNQSRWTPGQLPNLQPPVELPLPEAPLHVVLNTSTELPAQHAQVVLNNTPTTIVPLATPWELTKYGKAAIAAGYKDRNAVMALLKSLDFTPGNGLDGVYGNNTIAREQALKNAGYTYNNGVWANGQGQQWSGSWNGNLIANLPNNSALQNYVSTLPGYMYSMSTVKVRDNSTDGRYYGSALEPWNKALPLNFLAAMNYMNSESVTSLPNRHQVYPKNTMHPSGTVHHRKLGGSIQKHQQGGTMSQEDQLEQMLTYATLGMIGYANSLKQPMDFATAVSQVMELAQSKPEALQEIASNKELIQAGVEIMKQQEPDTLLIISQPGGMRKVLAQLKQKKTMAKQGTKLDYIKNLKGICPEGYEMLYMKAGGSVGVCPVCKKKALKAEVEIDKCGKKMKKHAQGGISELMNSIKAELFLKGGKPKVEHTDKEGNTYEYNDSTELKQHQDLIKKFKSKKPMTKEETKRLLELNKRLTS